MKEKMKKILPAFLDYHITYVNNIETSLLTHEKLVYNQSRPSL